MNWLPFKRRPRGGSRVLLTNGRRIVVAQFERGCYYHLWTAEADRQVAQSVVPGYLQPDPTHWMPLPEPPK